ncbi:hypothetical protein ACH429_22080 [Streptomyces pathocidini]|uniref:Uncharacterized protein n=1 Tax=Streptomyces pathocidini TaxID=1650571 RepID=A0ABW7UYQ6_9ACTN|nr:hypothetical protein [Streptomyces pathocidini]
MAVTISLVLLFGLILFFLLRQGSLSPGAAFTAAGFGFFLATTGATTPINQLTQALINAIPNL